LQQAEKVEENLEKKKLTSLFGYTSSLRPTQIKPINASLYFPYV